MQLASDLSEVIQCVSGGARIPTQATVQCFATGNGLAQRCTKPGAKAVGKVKDVDASVFTTEIKFVICCFR